MTSADDLLILFEGRFGQAVAERVASMPGVAVRRLLPALQVLDDLVSRAGFVGVALWRRYPAATDAVDAACARHCVPWSSATLEGRFLLMGPLVTPGRGCCHSCYRKRWLTHLALPEREQALDLAYDADPEIGCEGFLPSSVTVAAAGLMLDRAEADVAPGRVRRLDLLNAVCEETRAIRVHGCDRCGRPLPPGARYVHHLLAALREDAP
jgi:bacteriocin biosynthesis cyclodehydratase domain-containing protein